MQCVARQDEKIQLENRIEFELRILEKSICTEVKQNSDWKWLDI